MARALCWATVLPPMTFLGYGIRAAVPRGFTPMGKVIQLPRGSTPIDFAYAIHSVVGDTCTGAKINGRIVPLRSELKNGDVVEILTTQNSKPSGDWLNHTVTSRARNRIRHYISLQQRTESIEIGRKLLEKEAEKFRV